MNTRLTLAAAAHEGLKCRLVLEQRVAGSYRKDASGNNFLFDLLGAETTTVVEGGTDLAAAMQVEADKLKAQGRKGYVIPGGGSNALGAMGYVVCAREILNQSLDMGLAFTDFLVASGSAGTHAGLLVGFGTRKTGLRGADAGAARRRRRSLGIDQVHKKAFPESADLGPALYAQQHAGADGQRHPGLPAAERQAGDRLREPARARGGRAAEPAPGRRHHLLRQLGPRLRLAGHPVRRGGHPRTARVWRRPRAL